MMKRRYYYGFYREYGTYYAHSYNNFAIGQRVEITLSNGRKVLDTITEKGLSWLPSDMSSDTIKAVKI